MALEKYMENTTIKTSVAIAYYFGDKYISDLLESISKQTVKVDEVIISIDGGLNSLEQIVDLYKYDLNIKLISNKKKLGFARNFMKAINTCKGNFIFIADQDDVWLANKVQICLDSIGDNYLLHTDASLIDHKGVVIKSNWKGSYVDQNFSNLLYKNCVTGCTILINRKLLDVLPDMPSEIIYHDWYLGVISSYYKKIKYLSEPLVLYRQHSDQQTSNLSLYWNPIKRFKRNVNNLLRHYNDLKCLKSVLHSKLLLNSIENFDLITSKRFYLNYKKTSTHFNFSKNKRINFIIFLIYKVYFLIWQLK